MSSLQIYEINFQTYLIRSDIWPFLVKVVILEYTSTSEKRKSAFPFRISRSWKNRNFPVITS